MVTRDKKGIVPDTIQPISTVVLRKRVGKEAAAAQLELQEEFIAEYRATHNNRNPTPDEQATYDNDLFDDYKPKSTDRLFPWLNAACYSAVFDHNLGKRKEGRELVCTHFPPNANPYYRAEVANKLQQAWTCKQNLQKMTRLELDAQFNTPEDVFRRLGKELAWHKTHDADGEDVGAGHRALILDLMANQLSNRLREDVRIATFLKTFP